MSERDVFDGLDLDTHQNGVEPPFNDWEDDHTALVHVLWDAKHRGWMTNDADCDEIASMILRSRWLAATKHRASPSATRKDVEAAVLARLEAKSSHDYQWPRWAAADEASHAIADLLRLPDPAPVSRQTETTEG